MELARTRRVRTVVLFTVGACVVACGSATPPPLVPISIPSGGCVEDRGHAIERVCVPRKVPESQISMEVEGCSNACSVIDRCSVAVDGREITLSLDGKTCNVDCDVACVPRRVFCETPKLDPGKYVIRYGDGSGKTDLVEVGIDEGYAARCAL